MIAALLLAASSPAQFGISPFVEPPHEHEWQPFGEEIEEEDADKAWWDKNGIGKAQIDGVEYPRIIMRSVFTEDRWLREPHGFERFAFIDVSMAIDCEGNRYYSIEDAPNGQRVTYPSDIHPITPRFKPLTDTEMDAAHDMMRAVCGEGWTR